MGLVSQGEEKANGPCDCLHDCKSLIIKNLSENGPDRKRPVDEDRSGLRWLGYGVEFIGVLAIFTLGGLWMDRRFGTMPLFMLLGMFFALTGMIYLLWKETSQWRK